MNDGHRIELVGLTKRFGAFVALDHASLKYEGARAVGYLGPNGAGKTTTLKLLTTLLRPTEGHALIDGIDVAEESKKALTDVGAIIETPEPYPQLKVREALELVGEFRGVRGAELSHRIQELNDELELPPMNRRMGKLSKGQRQRVVFAGTILADPRILLLDEPSSGLDPAERIKVRNILLRFKKDHLILMSSHLLGEVTEICDDVVFINHGKILLQDSADGIAIRTRSRQVDVTFASPVSADRIAFLGTLVSHVETLSDRRYRLGFDGSDASRARILEGLVKTGPVIEYSAVGSALEDTYMQLMVGDGPASAPRVPPPPPPFEP